MCIKAPAVMFCEHSVLPSLMEDKMPEIDGQDDGQIREIAYFMWLQEGCPEGRADEHWTLACGLVSVQVIAIGESEASAAPPATGEPDPTAQAPTAQAPTAQATSGVEAQPETTAQPGASTKPGTSAKT
jgi:hypothetical protein